MVKISFYDAIAKGRIGEEIVRDFLQQEGYVIYEPIKSEPHPFDKVCVKDKSKLYLIEVKTKQSTDTGEYGIDNLSLNTYKYFLKEYNLPMLVFFIDYNINIKELRYTSLTNLLKPTTVNNKEYPYIMYLPSKEVCMFHMSSTKLIRTLTDVEYNTLT
jgi:hypothetical protein